jgi:Flp pilus assembly protein TadD
MTFRPLVAAVAVLGLGVAVFLPALPNGFVAFDDGIYVYGNRMVREGFSPGSLWWALTTTDTGNWHPVTWLSHLADAEMHGLDPWGHHLSAVLLHSLVALSLLLVLRAMTGWGAAALAAALLFAVHPLRVESVAWVAERKDVLAGLFFTLALGAHLRYARRPAGRAMLPTLAVAVLALASKPSAVTLPFALLLLDWWPLGRVRGEGGSGGAGWGALAVEKAPLLVLAAAASWITLLAQSTGGAVVPLEAYPFAARAGNALTAYLGYLGKTLWPTGLAIFYPERPAGIPWAGAAAVFGLLAGITLLLWRWRGRHPWALLGWLWFLGTLFPVIGLVKAGGQSIADRYTYLPHQGLLLGLVLAARAATGGRRRGAAVPVALTLLLGLLSLLTIRQLSSWRDTGTLFGHATAVTRGNRLAHYNLAAFLDAEGRTGEAIAHYQEALRINPRHLGTRINLARDLRLVGRLPEAEVHYREALRQQPDSPLVHNNLGNVLNQTGRTGEAEEHYRRAIALSPGWPDPHNNLATLLLDRGRWAEARTHLEQALLLRPGYAEARHNLERLKAAASAGGGDPPR